MSGTCLDRALDVEMSVLAVEACAKRADVAGIAKVQRADVCISAARRDRLFVCFRLRTVRRATSRGFAPEQPPSSRPASAIGGESSDTNGDTTLSGGSLGSRVDEERSQLRELM